jgi:hypothetical protein
VWSGPRQAGTSTPSLTTGHFILEWSVKGTGTFINTLPHHSPHWSSMATKFPLTHLSSPTHLPSTSPLAISSEAAGDGLRRVLPRTRSSARRHRSQSRLENLPALQDEGTGQSHLPPLITPANINLNAHSPATNHSVPVAMPQALRQQVGSWTDIPRFKPLEFSVSKLEFPFQFLLEDHALRPGK